MRLSEWQARAPYKDALSSGILTAVEATLGLLGGEPDPSCWIIWGDDPSARYLILAPTEPGLLQVNVRVNVPGEGPRASGKLLRWNRVQTGELATEFQGGHRLVTFQVESQVISGRDDEADAIGAFALAIYAAIDGRLPGDGPTQAGAMTARRGAKSVAQPSPPKGSAS